MTLWKRVCNMLPACVMVFGSGCLEAGVLKHYDVIRSNVCSSLRHRAAMTDIEGEWVDLPESPPIR